MPYSRYTIKTASLQYLQSRCVCGTSSNRLYYLCASSRLEIVALYSVARGCRTPICPPRVKFLTRNFSFLPSTAKVHYFMPAVMGDGTDYPSPRSEGPTGPSAILIAAPESISPSPKMNDHLSGIANVPPDGSRPRLSVRRSRDPPKNESNQIFCDHIDCQPNPPTFRRPCEWK